MPAEITTIMGVIQTTLAAAYPNTAILVKAAPASHSGRTPMPGWTQGNPLPSFVISEIDQEKIDEVPSFGFVSWGFPVVVEYAKTAPPQNWLDDPDVRTMRSALQDMFFKMGVAGMPANVFDVRLTMLPVYQPNEGGSVVISGVMLTYTLIRPRG